MLGALALAALVATAYWAIPSDSLGYEWLYNGRPFPADEVLKITRILATKAIPYETERGRVGVPRDKILEAQAAVDKLGAGPRSLKELLDEPGKASFLESPSDADERRQRKQARVLEEAIQKIDGSLSATVFLERKRNRTRSFDPAQSVQVTAYLDPGDDRIIPPEAIESIQHVLMALVPELKTEGLKLVDRKGRLYLDPANPGLVTRSHSRVLEEKLTAEIVAKLSWIEGARVFVKIDAPAPLPVLPPPAASRPEPLVVPNAPFDLEAEPASAAAPAGHERPAPALHAAGAEKARVLVQVPIEFFLTLYRPKTPGREPSPEDLKPYRAKTDERIRSAVAYVIPAAMLGGVTIELIDLPGPSHPPAAVQAEPLRAVPWWIPAGAAAGLTLFTLLGGRLLVARRPATRGVSTVRRNRFDAGQPSPTGPGPAERVRELVRTNPAAAAGVLQRWVGEGGHAR